MRESKLEIVKNSLYSPILKINESEEDAQLRCPVYLNRNKRLMKRIRKDLESNT